MHGFFMEAKAVRLLLQDKSTEYRLLVIEAERGLAI